MGNENDELKKQVLKDKERIKFLESELRVSREGFSSIVEQSNVGILILDKDGFVMFMNNKSEEIFHRKKEHLIGKHFGRVKKLKAKKEIDILRSNGEIGIGEISTSKTRWNGEPASLIIINDITQHVKLKNELTNALKQAQESDKVKTAFLANMSHEVRTPLNGIIGFAELIKEESDEESDKISYFANTITKCGTYLLKIINEILDISLLESNQIKIEKSVFNVVQSIEDVLNIFENHQSVLDKKINLVYKKPDNLKVMLLNDEVRFKQVYINLLNNAFKFTEQGNILTGFELKDEEIVVFVEDSGVGIDKTKADKVFSRFEKTELINERLNEGLGLGLAISKEFVELMGGRIWFDSVKNNGAKFYFTLPLHLANTEMEKEPVHIGIENNELKTHVLKRILIVEDEEINYMFIKSVLKEENIEIFWARNGKEAVDIVELTDVDIILMDMKMPLMNGFEATKQIKKLKPQIPIIAQTAYTLIHEKNKCMEAGCNDYISKPIDKELLKSKISAYF